MWNFNKLLGIKGIEILKYYQNKENFVFKIKIRRKKANCPLCQKQSKTVYDKREKTIKHGVIFGKFCYLRLVLRRFFCFSCHKLFTESFSFVKKYQRVTLNFKKELLVSLSSSSFSSNISKFKISYPTQRKYLKDIVSSLIFDFSKEEKENTPFVLGIDEVSFSGKEMLTTVGNITKRRLKGVLTSRKKKDLKKILKNLSSKIKPLIKEVVLDMCPLYKTTVKEELPDVKIVVDKFHLVFDANKRLESERLFLQQIYKTKIPKYPLLKPKEKLTEKERITLENIFKKFKEIKIFYLTKERLRDLYHKKTKEKAEEQLRFIISYLKSSDDGELIRWGRTLFNFKDEILNYFDSYSTNGFMEGINNKIKLIKRISYGFKNRQVFIQKIMLSVLIFSLIFH